MRQWRDVLDALRGVTLWEGGHRVPCFIRWPRGQIGGGRDVTAVTQCQDLLPTLIELCHLQPPSPTRFDGVSLAGALRGTGPAPTDRMLVVQFSRMNAPRCGRSLVRGQFLLWQATRLETWRRSHETTLLDRGSIPADRFLR